MAGISGVWNPKQALLRKYLSDKNKFDSAIKLCLEMHALVHSKTVSDCKKATYMDQFLEGLTEEIFREKSTRSDATPAWNIWHITRIEDLTVNILIANRNQILNKNILKKKNSGIMDTGNAMTADEIREFSSRIKMNELVIYRNAVGKRTREIINELKPEDLKRKMTKDRLNRIIDEGGVLENKESIWLVDFWGKKNVSGILLMPVTRHQIVHLNSSLDIKAGYLKKMKRRMK